MSDHVTVTCGECSEPVCFTRARYEHLQATGETWTCSRGHARHFEESEVSRLKKALAAMERNRDYWKRRFEYEQDKYERADRRRIAYQAASTRAHNKLRQVNA